MPRASDDPPDGGFEPRTLPPADLGRTRPFYWSVLRALWENRSIYVAPAVAGLVVLLGALILVFTIGLMLLNGVTPSGKYGTGWYSIGLVIGGWLFCQGLLGVAQKRRR